MEQNNERSLHLILCHKWFKMIEDGIKNEEYRERTPYWCKRFSQNNCIPSYQGIQWQCAGIKDKCNAEISFPYTHIVFHDGYTNTIMKKKVISCTVGVGRREWGAPNHSTFIIKFKDCNK